MSKAFTKDSFDAKWQLSETGCWEWLATKNQDGYGRVRRFGVLCSAHRVSYELYVGPLGDQQVLHTCDNPGCVNPEHLWLGTHTENQADKAQKGRAIGHPMPGEIHPSHKLNTIQVIEILQDCRSQSTIAKNYQVSQSLVWKIKNKKSWKHLDISL